MSLANLYSHKETSSAEFLGSDRGMFRSEPETCQSAIPTPTAGEQKRAEQCVLSV